jgi:hypothetical protein
MRTRVILILSVLCWMIVARAIAQVPVLKGTVTDSLSGRPLERAIVCLVQNGKIDSIRVLTDTSGSYNLYKVPGGDFIITASFVGYDTKVCRFRSGINGNLGVIALVPRIREMQQVILEAPSVSLKLDTVEYQSNAFSVRKDATLEDLLKKIPGIQIDQNGNITAYGRPVIKIRIGGKDFFVGDPRLASQNLPAEVIDKIQLIDDKSDQSKLTGFDDGAREQVINITIKKARTDSYFGNLTGGGGTEGRYLAAGEIFRFGREQQIAMIGGLNNTNGSNITSGSATSGPPYNKSGYTGLDFSGKPLPNLSLSGSYNYSSSHSISEQSSIRRYFLDTSYSYTQENQTDNRQQSHYIQMTAGYGAAKRDSLILQTYLTYTISHQQTANAFNFADASGTVTSTGTQAYTADNNSPNISGSLNWLHRFSKAGRILSGSVKAGPGPVKETDNNFSTNHIYSPSAIDTIWQTSDIHTKNRQYAANLNYVEPLGDGRKLELTYNYNRNENIAGKNVYDVSAVNKILNDSLTNLFDNSLTTHKLGIYFRQSSSTVNYQVGLALQPTWLDSRSVILDTPKTFRQPSLQLVPLASFFYLFSPSRRISFFYYGYTQQPAINQLQPVPDYTNPLYVAEGNPRLKPSFNHVITIGYDDINKISGRSFFLNWYTTIMGNAIVNNITLFAGGKQIVQPVNVNGNYSSEAFYGYSLPLAGRTFVLSASGNIDYINNVSLQSGLRNTGRNWSGKQDLKIAYNKGKWLDLEFSGEYTLNSSIFSLNPDEKSQVGSWMVGQEGRVDFRGDISLRYSFNYTINEGVPPGIARQFSLMNMVLEKRILRDRGVFAVSINDLFNNSVGYNHVSGEGYTEDDQRTVMGRFVLGSFTWKFKQGPKGRMRP